MRPRTVTVSSATFSPWIRLNWRATDVGFGVALGCNISNGASLTYAVQHTFDDIWTPRYDWSAARVTTTVTVTKTAHLLTAADYWYVDPLAAAPFAGEFAVAAITDADNFTYTVANSGATSIAAGSRQGNSARVLTHSTITGKSANSDGNYAYPPQACRLIVTAWTSGSVSLTVIQAGG